MLPLIPSATGHHKVFDRVLLEVHGTCAVTNHLNHYHTIQNRREWLIPAHILCTFSNTRSKTRGARSQMESKGALECHPLDEACAHVL